MSDIERFELGNNIGTAFTLVGRNLGALAVIFGAWTLLLAIVGIGGTLTFQAAIEAFPPFAQTVSELDPNLASALPLIPFFIFFFIALAAVIIVWHRRLITGEKRWPLSVGPDAIFRYIACVIVVSIVSFAPIILAAAAGATLKLKPADVGGDIAFGSIAVVLLILGIIASMRFSLMFPAIAVADRSMTLARSWQLTKYNTWRLVLGAFVCAIPYSIVGRILENLLEVPGLAETPTGIGLAILNAIVELLSYVTLAAFISLAYIQLTGLDAAQDRPPASHFS
jgi:hypothetical protein